MMSKLVTVLAAAVTCGACGCQPPIHNQPLETYEPDGGYRFTNLERGEHNTDSVFVVLTFSGGGTRAAALAYGVLQGLRDTPIEDPSGALPGRSVLDEVDAISSVSGGSITNMAYGLWGEGIFDGRFEQRFLRQNIQGAIVLSGLNPINLVRLPTRALDKSDLSAALYDRRLFQGATYGDLLARGRRPFVVINAADMTRQEQFQFRQSYFNYLGSDLAELPVSTAVAASSAYPVLLDPVRLKYYPGPALTAAIENDLAGDEATVHRVRRRWAESLIDMPAYESSGEIHFNKGRHKYMYLVDGGVVDNLGLGYFFRSLTAGDIRRLIEAGRIRRLVVIIVDAGVERPPAYERSASTPGGLKMGVASATSGIHTTTWLMKLVARYLFLGIHNQMQETVQDCNEWFQQDCPGAEAFTPGQIVRVEPYVVDVNFQNIEDRREREHLSTMPTNFNLNDQQVDDLIAAGRNLVVDNPEFRRLMSDLQQGR